MIPSRLDILSHRRLVSGAVCVGGAFPARIERSSSHAVIGNLKSFQHEFLRSRSPSAKMLAATLLMFATCDRIVSQTAADASSFGER